MPRQLSEREEFELLFNRLGFAYGQQEAEIRHKITRWPQEMVIQHLAALWPKYETLRRQAWQRILLLFLLVVFIGGLEDFLTCVFGITVPRGLHRILAALPSGLGVGCVFLYAPPAEWAGMVKLLPLYRDARLLGANIDALNFYVTRQYVTNKFYRASHLQMVRLLLPQYPSADVPPFNDSQRKTLLRELKRLSRRLRQPVSTVTCDEAELMVAIVRALEADALRFYEQPTPAMVKSLTDMEKVLAAVELDANHRTHAPDFANNREVREATENAVLRLRGLREGI